MSLLQELTNLNDQDALDSLTFDVRWQHALRLKADEAYLSRRSLVDFRSRLVKVDPQMTRMRALFDRIVEVALSELKLDTSEQRVDSTQICSNIRTRGRVDLFSKTLRHFLTRLEREHPEWFEQLSEDLVSWFKQEPKGWFGDGNKKENRARLETLTRWLYQVTVAFAKNKVIKSEERYQLVVRLFDEHCEVVAEPSENPNDKDDQCKHGPHDDDVEGGSDDGDRGLGRQDEESESSTPQVQLRNKAPKGGATLQSPFDPDAGYNHKGVGYSLHVTETCGNKGPELLTDFGLTSGKSDKGYTDQVLDRLNARGLRPATLFADGGYTTGPALVNAEERGTRLHSPADAGRRLRVEILR